MIAHERKLSMPGAGIILRLIFPRPGTQIIGG